MDLDEIRQILELMREHELSEFELERDQMRLRLSKGTGAQWTAAPPLPSQVTYAPPLAAAAPAPLAGLPTADNSVLTAANEDVDLAIVKSPIVGTFYRAAEPGARPFIEVGQNAKKGQVLCIIEAMKLMNEINSECDGEVVKVFVENGQAVQYGERLFAIRPS
jgi:acetyl-CoA carboxylase biotin carboxyl carrier protein